MLLNTKMETYQKLNNESIGGGAEGALALPTFFSGGALGGL